MRSDAGEIVEIGEVGTEPRHPHQGWRPDGRQLVQNGLLGGGRRSPVEERSATGLDHGGLTVAGGAGRPPRPARSR